MGGKADILQGTLDLMVLQTLDVMGPLHGYGIARRIEQISEDVLQLNQGTIYASLLRLQQRRWISASWGTSDNNRKAKYYAITRAGRGQLAAEAANWRRISDVMMRMMLRDHELRLVANTPVEELSPEIASQDVSERLFRRFKTYLNAVAARETVRTKPLVARNAKRNKSATVR